MKRNKPTTLISLYSIEPHMTSVYHDAVTIALVGLTDFQAHMWLNSWYQRGIV